MSTVNTLYDETVTGGFAKLLTVNTVTSNVASINFTIPSNFDTFWFEVTNVTFTYAGNDFLIIYASGDGGSTFGSYNMSGLLRLMNNFSGTAQYIGVENVAWMMPYAFCSAQPLSGRIRMRSAKNLFFWRMEGFGDTYMNHSTMGGGRCQTLAAANTTINFIKFGSYNGGLYKPGSAIRLYGMRTGA